MEKEKLEKAGWRRGSIEESRRKKKDGGRKEKKEGRERGM